MQSTISFYNIRTYANSGNEKYLQKARGTCLINPLLKEIEDNEVKSAVFSLEANKAPSCDGLSEIFYQKAWKIVS